jgi:putative salt-induced outer membrane protein YdiY
MPMTRRAQAAVLFVSSGLGLLLLGRPAMAQPAIKEPPPVWDTSLATSFVGTSGNSDTTTLGSDYSLHRRWPVWRIEVVGSAVRTTDNGAKTAERYLGAFNGQRKLTSFLSLSAGERAESDRLAGIDFRSIASAGLTWDVLRQRHLTV